MHRGTGRPVAKETAAGRLQHQPEHLPSAQYWDIWTEVPFGITIWAHRPLGIIVPALAFSAEADGTRRLERDALVDEST